VESDEALRGVPCDVSRMHELIGPAVVDWREGMRRLVQASHPELVGI
jgi:UDP-glucuronate 4-epimerase